MDYALREALRSYRLDHSPESAAALCRAMDQSGIMPDSPSSGALPVSCDLDGLGNATGHLSINGTRLLLFHKTVVGVQHPGQPGVINPEWSTSPTTRKRIREWPGARHVIDTVRGVDISPDEFNKLITFKAV